MPKSTAKPHSPPGVVKKTFAATIACMSTRKPRPIAQPAASEPPAIETLTVGWMLSVLTALVCELGFVAARGYLLAIDSTARRIEVLAVMLMFAALVVGSTSVALMVGGFAAAPCSSAARHHRICRGRWRRSRGHDSGTLALGRLDATNPLRTSTPDPRPRS